VSAGRISVSAKPEYRCRRRPAQAAWDRARAQSKRPREAWVAPNRLARRRQAV